MTVEAMIGIIAGIILPIIGVSISAYRKLNDDTNRNSLMISELTEKLDKHVEDSEKKITAGFLKLDDKTNKLQEVEIRLKEYLKKVEAEKKFVTKEMVDIHIKSLKESDEILRKTLENMKIDMDNKLEAIKIALDKHTTEDKKLLEEILKKIG